MRARRACSVHFDYTRAIEVPVRVLLIVGVVAAWWVFGRKSSATGPGLPSLPGSNVIANEAIASFYGGPSNPVYEGRPTASGEIFDSHLMTAAMRKPMPFGTKVKVTDLDNGRSVVVKVNDRGPFVEGRTIDLSAGAAAVIGLDIQKGLARVRLEKV